jgi:hypothetical protein
MSNLKTACQVQFATCKLGGQVDNDTERKLLVVSSWPLNGEYIMEDLVDEDFEGH